MNKTQLLLSRNSKVQEDNAAGWFVTEEPFLLEITSLVSEFRQLPHSWKWARWIRSPSWGLITILSELEGTLEIVWAYLCSVAPLHHIFIFSLPRTRRLIFWGSCRNWERICVESSRSSCFWIFFPPKHSAVISNSMVLQVNSFTQKFPCLI